MTGINWLCLLVHVLGLPHLSFQQIMRDEIHFYYNNTYKFNTPYVLEVNKSTEYILEFAGDSESYTTPARVSVASDFANRTYPLFITARQQKGVFSWQLPMLVQTPLGVQQFTNVSRTLCPRNNLWAADEDTCDVTTPNTPIVHLTSSSPESVRVTITVETVPDFYIQLNTTTNLTTTPSQPKYYFFPFDQNHHLDLESQHERRLYRCQDYGGNWGGVNLAGMKSDGVNVNGLKSDGVNVNGVKSDGVNVNGVKSDGDSWRGFMEGTNLEVHSWLSRPKSVIVMIESDDDICAVVSIQNVSCPVFDNERDILYDGYYLTMTRRGGITLTQDTFPLGFYIVFIVKTSDEDCNDNSVTNGTLPRGHYVGWGEGGAQVWSSDGRVKNFSFRIIQTISYQEYVIAASVPLAFFGSFYVAFLLAILCQRKYHRPGGTEHQAQEEEGRLTPPSVPHDEVNVVTTRRRHVNVMSDSGGSSSRQAEGDTIPIVAGGSSSSDTDSDFSTLEDIQAEKDLYMLGTRLCVANLARCRPRVLSARSKMYLWNVLTVAVFYTLPVIQLVVTYQRLLNQSGNQDLCYYNFLCAHPLVVLSDFNHVYSNLGYVMLGALFLALVRRRRAKHDARPAHQKQLGIPQHFGLLYAMGVALVSEGLLSAAYHVCPNSMNFQFDTSFMYVTAVLCMVKLYQSRHADINARAHATFGVLALVIFIGLVGVLNANFYFWVAFTVLHLVTCLIMTFQIYYLGRFRLDAAVLVRAARELVAAPLAAVTPTHCGRCVLLLIANATNWALAAYGVAQQSRDFASHLLLVLMTNLFLYTLFYIVMKLLHREAIRWYSWVFIGLTYSIWFGSSYFYLDQSTNWALTPAQSRQNNRQCSLLQLYDSHDIWHFLSASAMFFSFNMYLTIDDNLAHTPRSEIMVF